MKDHRSHDIVLLCIPCHRRSCVADSQLKEQLVIQCGDSQTKEPKYITLEYLTKVKSAAKYVKLYLMDFNIPNF